MMPVNDEALHQEELEAAAELEAAQKRVELINLKKRQAGELEQLRVTHDAEEYAARERDEKFNVLIALEDEMNARIGRWSAAMIKLAKAFDEAVRVSREVGPPWIRAYKHFAFQAVPELCGVPINASGLERDERLDALLAEMKARGVDFGGLRMRWPDTPDRYALSTDNDVHIPYVPVTRMALKDAGVPLSGEDFPND